MSLLVTDSPEMSLCLQTSVAVRAVCLALY